jgi:integrase
MIPGRRRRYNNNDDDVNNNNKKQRQGQEKKQRLQLTGQSYSNFINSIKSAQSRIYYQKSLKFYLNYRKLDNVDQLLEEGGDPRLIQSQIIDYIVYLRDTKKLSSSSINGYSAVLKHFYEMNDIELRWKKINSFKPEDVKVTNDRPYAKAEIAKMLEKADYREKAIILLMASSGMRKGAVCTLRIRNLIDIQKYDIYQICVYENTKYQYITFCSQECKKAIDNYISYRDRYGERIKPTSPLIREQFDRNDQFQIATPRSIAPENIKQVFDKILLDSGLREKRHLTESQILNKQQLPRFEIMQSHGLRKFFETQAIKAGLNPLYTKILMGHDIGLEESYFKPSPEDLLEGNDKMLGYVSIIDALTINEENRLKIENKKIKQRNDILEGERHEIISLQKQLEPLLALKNTLIKEGILRES